MPDREGDRRAVFVQLAARLVVHAQVRAVFKADIQAVDLFAVAEHGEHRPAHVRGDAEVVRGGVIRALLAQDHGRGRPVEGRVRQGGRRRHQAPPVFKQALRHGLQHVDVVDDLGEIVVRDLRLLCGRIDEGALQDRLHRGLRGPGDRLLLLRLGFLDDLDEHPVLKNGHADEQGDRHKEHHQHQVQGLFLQAAEGDAQYFSQPKLPPSEHAPGMGRDGPLYNGQNL